MSRRAQDPKPSPAEPPPSWARSGRITHEEIASLAYRRYVERGRRDGGDLQDWLEAEKKLGSGTPALIGEALGLYQRRTI